MIYLSYNKNLRFIILNLLIIFSLCIPSNAEEIDSSVKFINDGPYMFWENDTTLSVYYINDNELVSNLYSGVDTIRFRGSGYDSVSYYKIPTAPPTISDVAFTEVSKIFMFSDPHGEFENLTELLIAAKIIDNSYNWIFGEGHLVCNGDIFDRGDKVNEILWLIYKLEQQAITAGGMVHYILGNHEVMPLQKDLRYIHDSYTKGICDKLGKPYDELYGRRTVVGQWLRSKCFIKRINNIMFVHGGLSPKMLAKKYSISDFNRIMQANIDRPREQIRADSILKALFGGTGLIWYRGYHYDMEKYKQATEAQIDSILSYYNVEHFVVGHTVLDSVTSLYNGKVFGINIDYEIRDEYEGLL